jgi:PIN domain nuclease of toxin-antitoxin system
METVLSEMSANAIVWLPIEMSHCREVSRLPFHHRDPFDRMLIAQARVEKMSLLSSDRQLFSYDVERIW